MSPLKLCATLALLTGSTVVCGEALRYQGELLDGGQPANGRYDLRLTPHRNASSKSSLAPGITFEDVLVEQGFFYLEPDFGDAGNLGTDIWLELGVRDAEDSGTFAVIEGRTKSVLSPLVGQCWSTTGDSGVNAATNFLGTTDGAPLVLRSSAGVGINTTSPRDMLTLRGPDDFLDGPNLQLLGDGADQVESGRIRFVEGSAVGNLRGAYIHYNGSTNMLGIGAHTASNADPAGDIDHLTIRRSSTPFVGIGKIADEVLDVAGSIQIDGGVRYAQRSSHFYSIMGKVFSELQESDCKGGSVAIFQRGGFGGGNCVASASITLPDGARIIALRGMFLDQTPDQSCSLALSRIVTGSGGGFVESLEQVDSGISFDGSEVTRAATGLNRAVDNVDTAYAFRFTSGAFNCQLQMAQVEYTLPGGFIP